MAKNIYSNDIENNLDVSAATYLGGSGDDETNAVDISLDGKVVIVGGISTDSTQSSSDIDLLGGGKGSIVRYDSQTNEIISTTNLPGKVVDLQVSDNGDIAVAYRDGKGGGIAVLNSDATEVRWSKSLSYVSKISISESGKVAAMRDIPEHPNGDWIGLFDNKGTEQQVWRTDKSTRHFYDVAITDKNGGQVIGVGYEQKHKILQVGFAHAWSFNGEEQWTNYDYKHQDLFPNNENLMADTRITAVSIGRDGELYMGAYVNGGVNFSIYSRDPHNLNEKADENVFVDKYNDSYNTDSIVLSYFGKYDLKDGDLIKGQSLIGRGSNGKGNTVKINSITATEDGTVVLGGVAAYGIENRDKKTIEGQEINPYTLYDGYIAIIDSSFEERLAWTPITSKSSNTVAAVRNGIIAAGSTTTYKGDQITHNAIQENKAGGAETHLVVIGGDDPLSDVELAPPVAPVASVEEEEPTNGGSTPTPVKEEEPQNGGSTPTPVKEEEPTNGGSTPTPVKEEEPTNGGSTPTPVKEEEPTNGGSVSVPIEQKPKSNIVSPDNSSSPFKDKYTNGIDNNLDISAATYLGGEGNDVSQAVDISLDGKSVLVGGTFTADFGVEKTTLLGGGTGSIVRYDSQTNEVISVTELPKRVSDIQVAANGDIAVAYNGGVAVLNSDATEIKWSKSVEGASRVSISENGKVAVMQDIRRDSDRVVLFDAQGSEIQSWETGSDGRHFNDVTVTDQNGGQVIATGYTQKTSILQVSFTQAWSFDGEEKWKNYDYSAKDLEKESLMADTRGERLTIGQDGQLYVAHYINGGTGASLYSREALDLSQSAKEENVVTDKYNNPYNTGPMSMTYYGQYDLNTGELIKGQSLLGRRSGDNGNTVKVNSIAATKNGTLILGGSAAYGIENREELTIEGQKANKYTFADGYLAVISPDFQERVWSPIASKSKNVVAAARDGVIAVGATTDYKGDQITHNAVQENKGGQSDGFLVVLGGDDPTSNVEISPVDNLDVVSPATPVDNPVNNPVIQPENTITPGEETSNPVIQSENTITPGKETPNPVIQPENTITPGKETPNPVTQPENTITPGKEILNPTQKNVLVQSKNNKENLAEDKSIPVVSSSNSFDDSQNTATNYNQPLKAGMIDLRNIDLNNDGQVDSSVDLAFSEIESNASYANSIGYYRVINEQGAVRDPLSNEIINPDEEGYAKAAMMQRVEGISINKNTDSLLSEVKGGELLAPYLVANGTAEEFLSKNSANEFKGGPLAYFSVGSNIDGKQHIKQVGNNSLRFEDMYGGGDMDYDDFSLKVNIKTRTV